MTSGIKLCIMHYELLLQGKLVTNCQSEYAVLEVLVSSFLVQLGETNLIACVDNDRHFELIRNTNRNSEVKLLEVVLNINRCVNVCVSVCAITKISLAFCMHIEF